MPVGLVGGIVGLSMAPALVLLLRRGDDLTATIVAGIVLGGSAVALAVVDPAASVLASSPIPLLHRWGTRVGVIAALVMVAWVPVLTAVVLRDPLSVGRVGDRLGELLAVTGLGAAAGAYADRRYLSATAATVVGPMAVLVVSSMAYRFPSLPTVGGRGDGARWAAMGAAAWCAALWERRDPLGFARPRRPR